MLQHIKKKKKKKKTLLQVNVEPSRVILPRICDRGSVVRYSEIQPEAEVEAERYKQKRKFTHEQHQQQPGAKRISPGLTDVESNQVKYKQWHD